MNKYEHIIARIESVLIDSELNTYEAIGVLEVVKELLFKAIELRGTVKINTEKEDIDTKTIFDIIWSKKEE